MAEIVLQNLSKSFGAVRALQGLDLSIGDGEFVALLGPTGAGKTTTLRLTAGLEKPDAGRVFIGGRDVTEVEPAGRDVAFVFQNYSLYPHLTVFDNLAFPLRSPARRVAEKEVTRQVHDIAELLHLSGKLKNKATKLSGGEMQRVALGRALVRRPAVYLMDEPLSSLDAKLRADLRLELKRIQKEMGATILYVTHDQVEAMTLASRIGVLNQGRLVQVGTPRQIYEDPHDVYVASRLGTPAINLVPVEALHPRNAPSSARTLGLRTEHVRISAGTDAAASGRVIRIEHLGDQSHLHIEANGHHLVTLAEPHLALAAGQAVSLELMNPLYFDEAGQRIVPQGKATAEDRSHAL
jgi:multiple sugar transport system ATP-binding protein